MSDPGGQPPSKRYQLQKCRKLIRGGRGSEIQKSLNYPMGGGSGFTTGIHPDPPSFFSWIHHWDRQGSTSRIQHRNLPVSTTEIYQEPSSGSTSGIQPDPPTFFYLDPPLESTRIHYMNSPGSITSIHNHEP